MGGPHYVLLLKSGLAQMGPVNEHLLIFWQPVGVLRPKMQDFWPKINILEGNINSLCFEKTMSGSSEKKIDMILKLRKFQKQTV